MKKNERNKKPVKIFSHPQCYMKPTYVIVQILYLLYIHMSTGFVGRVAHGYGTGWQGPTCTCTHETCTCSRFYLYHTCTHMGAGFVGMGPGWTLLTCTVPRVAHRYSTGQRSPTCTCTCKTHTHSVFYPYPRVLGNTVGTCKPIPVFHYFSISTWTLFVFLFLFFVFCYVLCILCVLYLWYNIVTT